jgi:outer membrane protein TolC
LLSLVSMTSQLAWAEGLTERDVVQQAMTSNPTVRAARDDVSQALASVRAEQTRYRPSLLAGATGSTARTPYLSLGTDTGSQTNQGLTLGLGLTQSLPWGTVLDLRLENTDTRSEAPLTSGSTSTVTLGPGYGVSAKLSVTQSLLRGAGADVGLASLRDALLAGKEAERARQDAASSTLSEALQAWWELWYDQRAVIIQRDALGLARQQRDEAAKKQAAGSLADVDVLAFETRVAELEQAVLAAEVTAHQQAASLCRALACTDVAHLEASLEASPPEPASRDEAQALAQAKEASFSVLKARLGVERSELALRTAGDASRARLDLKAWVKTEGLGNQSMSAAFTGLSHFDDVSANVGVSFELPLSGERHDAQVGSARAALAAAKERLLAAEQETEASIRVEEETLRQAGKNVELARLTEDVARRSSSAQARKYAAGSSTPLEVREAEDSLRKARLSVERERVNARKAELRLQHLTGELLARWSVASG